MNNRINIFQRSGCDYTVGRFWRRFYRFFCIFYRHNITIRYSETSKVYYFRWKNGDVLYEVVRNFLVGSSPVQVIHENSPDVITIVWSEYWKNVESYNKGFLI